MAKCFLMAPASKTFPTNGCLLPCEASKYYMNPPLGAVPAQHPLVRRVHAQQWCTMVGPRQAGKTTTAQALAAALNKTSIVRCLTQSVTPFDDGITAVVALMQLLLEVH